MAGRELEPRVQERRLDPVPRLLHGGFGQSDDGHARQAPGQVHLPAAGRQADQQEGHEDAETHRCGEAQAQGAGQDADIEDLLAQLEARMAAQPDDLEGWLLLARTLKASQQYAEAADALEQARKSDKVAGEAVRQGQPLGPLHGIPVGIKDIIDTRDLPTENGTVLHAGRRPEIDAALVTRLKEAGAVILGKTVTTELAVFHPGKTRNPHNPNHTPGGSSSGSAGMPSTSWPAG